MTYALPLGREFINGAAIGGTINVIAFFALWLYDTNWYQDEYIEELFSRLEACEEKNKLEK